MPSPKARPRGDGGRAGLPLAASAGPRVQGAVVGVALTLAVLALAGSLRPPQLRPAPAGRDSRRFAPAPGEAREPRVALFIAIGSAPANADLRGAARRGWLRWLPDDGSVEYRFFSDARPAAAGAPPGADVWDALEAEGGAERDLVLQPLATGYGSNSENAYGQRALYQLAWARRRYGGGLEFFLRVDDDSFLCLHRLLYELKTAPRAQFFWGRFWCREGRNRADENFMLFSADVAALLGDDAYVGKILPFDESVTLGWNFGLWSWVMNLTVFDDQTRLDAQQGYLTDYMHAPQAADRGALSAFCDVHMYAHHVHAPVALAAYEQTTARMMYPIPKRTSPRETCSSAQRSFLPGRHSSKLPNVRIGLPDAR
jgi:hypothetical protein